jgi:hypothetical protein
MENKNTLKDAPPCEEKFGLETKLSGRFLSSAAIL